MAVGLLVAATSSAGAQWAASPRFGIAGGVDARDRDNAGTMYLGVASAQWRQARSGFGARAELLYARRISDSDDGCEECNDFVTEVDVEAIGLMAAATYELMRGSAIRPYLLSGLGAIRTKTEITVEVPCDPGPCGPTVPQPPPIQLDDSEVALSLNAGAGIAIDVGRATVTVEVRYLLTDPARLGSVSGIVPVMLGIRF